MLRMSSYMSRGQKSPLGYFAVAFVNTSHLNIVHILFRHTFLRLQFGVVQAYNPSVNLHSWAYMRNSGI